MLESLFLPFCVTNTHLCSISFKLQEAPLFLSRSSVTGKKSGRRLSKKEGLLIVKHSAVRIIFAQCCYIVSQFVVSFHLSG